MGSAFTMYSILRFGLFFVCFAIAYALGWGNLYGLLGAAVVSAILSWFFLRGPREQVAEGLQERIEGRVEKKNQNAKRSAWELDNDAEDREIDSQR